MAWTFQDQHAGTYRIEGDLAATAPSAFTISCGSARLEVSTEVRDGYTAFQKVVFGTLEIGAGQPTTLQITPIEGQWTPINLRSLTLTPQ